ncbi:argininosuccinate lyase [Lacibacterium aquatile]|uniref:Argininosuccinate lyase n=1 Tax=Lacibacterium aquatile TaxID=1168082 RepID=A0ABW5DUE5_9PROT
MSSSNNADKTATNQLWGGRFASGPAAIMEKINASIGFDKKLYRQDIAGSKAHAEMMTKQGVLKPEDNAAIQAGLDSVLQEIEEGRFEFKVAHEDIHMNVEARLSEIIGPAAGRLHTGRSRNDQVAVDLKLWLRDAIDQLIGDVKALQSILIRRAEEHADTVMPGFTHLQPAQPVTFGHHLLAYVEMLGRDRSRLADCRARLNESPLGAAALAGTPYPLDRHFSAKLLGFDKPTENSLDSVSDRDFAMEFLGLGAIMGVHLSRLAEEIVNWSSPAFGFVRVADAFSSGSSIMPQKRNPDAAELIRAKAGRTIGNLNSLLIVMKGLPLAYCKDMQDDKEPVFEAVETLSLSLAAMTGMFEGITINKDRMRGAAEAGFITATDLADWLVLDLGMPFRDAHHVTGRIVALAEAKGQRLDELTLEEMQSVHGAIHKGVFGVLTVEGSVARRTSYGGTSPTQVRDAITRAKARFL